jgi:hypothetical protein
MRPEIVAGEYVPACITRAFEGRLRSNVYAVLHLKREVDGIRGERSIYVSEALRFMARLSSRIRGKNAYKRLPTGRRFLPHAMSVEKLFDGPHFNLMIRRPDHWEFENFQAALVDEWIKSPWAALDERAIYVEPREVQTSLFAYCTKEGDEALIHETLQF